MELRKAGREFALADDADFADRKSARKVNWQLVEPQRHRGAEKDFRVMREWLTIERIYEGFPLFFRRVTNLDIQSLRPLLPNLAVVTHQFAKRKPNGLPEPTYNDGLAEMDHELITAFDVDRMGVPVLIETFGGERNYYFYIAADADAPSVISAIAWRYPDERLSWTIRPDPEWSSIERYAREHF